MKRYAKNLRGASRRPPARRGLTNKNCGKIDTTEKCNNISENCIIGNEEVTHAVSEPYENACSPIHTYFELTVRLSLMCSDPNTLFSSLVKIFPVNLRIA